MAVHIPHEPRRNCERISETDNTSILSFKIQINLIIALISPNRINDNNPSLIDQPSSLLIF